jgi:hypothetical protein
MDDGTHVTKKCTMTAAPYLGQELARVISSR